MVTTHRPGVWRRARLLTVVSLVASVLAVGATSPVGARTADQQIFPAFYDGDVREIMMGPGNVHNHNQLAYDDVIACGWGLGPDITKAHVRPGKSAPVLYAIYWAGATQMPCAADSGFTHDMILSAVPGDRGYSAIVYALDCLPVGSMTGPLTSASQVEAARNAGLLSCSDDADFAWGNYGGTLMNSPVVD